MTDEAQVSAPATEAAAPATPAASAPAGTATSESKGTQYAGEQAQAAEDAMYDNAFAALMADEAPNATPSAQAKPATPAPTQKPAAPGSSGNPQLTASETQLLQRNHVTAEMAASWTPDQLKTFLANAGKREADQQRAFQELQERAKAAQQPPAQEQPKPGQGSDTKAAAQQATPVNVDNLVNSLNQTATQVIEEFGEDIRPFATGVTQLAQATQQLNQTVGRLREEGRSKDLLISDLAIDRAVRDLTDQYPQLGTAEAREKVKDQMLSNWKADPTRYTNLQGSFLDRIAAAIEDAAKALFNQTTEPAAQVTSAPGNLTQQRLQAQPPRGSGKARPRPLNEEEQYDQAFDQFLKGR